MGVTTLVYQQISRPVLGTREFTTAGNLFHGADAGSALVIGLAWWVVS